jgi:hypothetical protein
VRLADGQFQSREAVTATPPRAGAPA